MAKRSADAPLEVRGLLEKSLNQCRTRQGVVTALREAFDAGLLPPGTRLPSLRKLQELSGLRYHEVYRALETLAAEGRIEQRHGSGTFVLESNGSVAKADKSELRIGIMPPAWDPDFSRYAMAQYFSGISNQADLKHRVQIIPARIAETSPSEFVAYIRYLHLDGVICIKPPVSPPLAIIRLYDAGIPTVLIGRSYPQLPLSTVDGDFASMGDTVADFIARHKRRKLLCMAGIRNDQQTARQIEGLRAALEKHGLSLPDNQIITVRIESAAQVYTLDLRESVLQSLMQHPDFDAVFTLHPDQVSTLEHLHQTGFRRCPEDFIHIHYGFYRNTYGHWPCPAFPSAIVGLPTAELGRQAVLELEKMMGIRSDTPDIDCAPRIVFDPYQTVTA